ncbi:AraC family transcriptional regulator [Sandaracinus amylolyticus]|uniref:Transcriptional regulator, AraC family protein n=1 Tax=Sandaracinus amylolyticus TaxID=927083 RepID=A0A0F6W3E4_9BACT|nr:helix-turn-helix domain-containing protein [Sandaracinus amylolyticus]AKF06398.1 Transcriptional regulator, AraC family protein [Sandaracinus amylolyticus]
MGSRFAPRAALRNRVATIDVIASDAPEVEIPPSTHVVLGLQFRGRVHAEEGPLTLAGVTGLQHRVRRYAYEPGTGSVLVRFTPTGASCVGVPVGELTGRSVALDALLPRARVAEVTERLAEAVDDPARVAVVEDLIAGLHAARDPLVSAALALIERGADPGDAPLVSRLATTLRTSERQLERRFAAVVGLSPRRYASLRRFERALSAASAGTRLTEVALDAGYYDQAHFNRDLRRFLGTSPGAWLRGRAR